MSCSSSSGAPRFSSFPLYDPFRLVVDVEADAPPAGARRPPTPLRRPPAASVVPAPPLPPRTQSPPQDPPAVESRAAPPRQRGGHPPAPAPPASTQPGDYSLARQLGLRVARVVIDPGHGGHDPGAQANGVTEAELVLDVALRLEKLLQQVPGLEVVLTRRTNEFIPLEERTAIANRENADLFLSIHANAHRQSAVRGIETYFLNFASNPEAEAVAARENATSAQTMGTLPAIVKAIALNNKLDGVEGARDAAADPLVRRLRTQSAATPRSWREAGAVRRADWRADAERADRDRVPDQPPGGRPAEAAAYRQHIAQALKDAVVRYQDSLKNVATVAARERTAGTVNWRWHRAAGTATRAPFIVTVIKEPAKEMTVADADHRIARHRRVAAVAGAGSAASWLGWSSSSGTSFTRRPTVICRPSARSFLTRTAPRHTPTQ